MPKSITHSKKAKENIDKQRELENRYKRLQREIELESIGIEIDKENIVKNIPRRKRHAKNRKRIKNLPKDALSALTSGWRSKTHPGRKWGGDYNKYLQSKEWQQLKQKLIDKRGRTCQCCGKDLTNQTVDVHHLTYKNIFREKEEDLQLVCRPCHTVLHPEKKRRGASKKARVYSTEKPPAKVKRPKSKPQRFTSVVEMQQERGLRYRRGRRDVLEFDPEVPF